MLRSLYLVLAVDKFFKARLVVIELAKRYAVETLQSEDASIEDFLSIMNTNYPEKLKDITTHREMKAEYKQMKSIYHQLKDIGL